MTTLAIADPSLVVLVGAAGSGKSTFAARHFGPDQTVSSDAFRELLSGDAADQRSSRQAFGLLHRAVGRRLAAGLLTIVDATNVERHARLPLVRRAAAAGIPVVAIVLDLDPVMVLEQNARRTGRIVDEVVVRRHLAALRRSVDPAMLRAEGFDEVFVIRTAQEVEDTNVVLRSTRWRLR